MNDTSSLYSSVARSSYDLPLRRMSTAAPGGTSHSTTHPLDVRSGRSQCKMSETRTFADHQHHHNNNNHHHHHHHDDTSVSFTAAYGDDSPKQERSQRNSYATNDDESDFKPALSHRESQVFSLQTAETCSPQSNFSGLEDSNAGTPTSPQFRDPNHMDHLVAVGVHRSHDEMLTPGGNQDMREAILRNGQGLNEELPPMLHSLAARSPLPRSPRSESAVTPWSRNRNSPSLRVPSPQPHDGRNSASCITDPNNHLETLTSYSHVAAEETMHNRNSRNFTPLEPMKSKSKRNHENRTFQSTSCEDAAGARNSVVQVAPTQDILAAQFGTRADDGRGTPAQMESGVNSFDDVTPGDSLSRLSTLEETGNNLGFPWGIVSFLGWKGHPSRLSPGGGGNVEMCEAPKVVQSAKEKANPQPQVVQTPPQRKENEKANGKAAPGHQLKEGLAKPHTKPANRSASRNADRDRGDFPSEVDRWSDFSSSNDPNGIQPFCPHRFYQQQYEAALLRGASPGDAAQRYSGLYPTGERATGVTDPRVDGALDEEVPVDRAGRKALRKKRREAEHEKRKREMEESRQRRRQESAASERRRPVLWLYEDAIGINSVNVRGAPHADKSGFAKYMRHGMYMFIMRFFIFGVLIPFIVVEAFILVYQYAPAQLCIVHCLCDATQSAIYIFTYGLLFYVPQAFLSPLLFLMLQYGLRMSRTHYGTARVAYTTPAGGSDQNAATSSVAVDMSRRYTGADNSASRAIMSRRASTQNADSRSPMRQSGRTAGIHVLDSTSVPYRSAPLCQNESQLLYFYFYDEATERFSLLEKDLSGQSPQGSRPVETDEQAFRRHGGQTPPHTPRESEAFRGSAMAAAEPQQDGSRAKRHNSKRASFQQSCFTVVPNNQNGSSALGSSEIPPDAQWLGKERETIGVAGRVYRCGWPSKVAANENAEGDSGADVDPEKSTDENYNREHFYVTEEDGRSGRSRVAREDDLMGSAGNIVSADGDQRKPAPSQLSTTIPHPGNTRVDIREENDTSDTGSESPRAKRNGLDRFLSRVGSILVAGGQLVVAPLAAPWDTNPVEGRASNAAHCNLMEYQSLELPSITYFLRDPALWIIAIVRFFFFAVLDMQLPRVENMPHPLADPIRMVALSVPLFVYSIYCSRPIDSIPFILMDIFPMVIQFIFGHLNADDDTSIGLAFAWPCAVTALLLLSLFVSGRCLPGDAPVQVKVAVCFCFNGMATLIIHAIALFMNIYTQYIIFVVFFFEILLLSFITSSSIIPRFNVFVVNIVLKLLKKEQRMMRLSVCSSFLSIFKHSQSISVIFSAVALAPTFQFMRWPQGSARTDCYGLINSDTIYSAEDGTKGTSWLMSETVARKAFQSSAAIAASGGGMSHTVAKNAWCSSATSASPQYLCDLSNDINRDRFPNFTRPEDSSASLMDASIAIVPYYVGTWESFLVLTAILIVAHLVVSAVRQSQGCLMAPTYPWDLWVLILVGCYIMRTTPIALSLVPVWHRAVA